MIGERLDASSRKQLTMASTNLFIGIGPVTLDGWDWHQFHIDYEGYIRRCHRQPLQTLACALCLKFRDSDLFSDSQRRILDWSMSPRFCIPCGIIRGDYATRNFQVRKVICFACAGCRQPKRLDQEDECFESTLRPTNIFQDCDQIQYISKKNRRWCKACWATLVSYRSLHNGSPS